MPTHSTTARNAAADAVVALLNGGTLEVIDGSTVLAILTFAATAFGAADDGTATAAAIGAEDAALAAGTADAWRAKDSSGTVVMAGTARKSTDEDAGEELVLENTSIEVGQQVSVTSFTYTALSA